MDFGRCGRGDIIIETLNETDLKNEDDLYDKFNLRYEVHLKNEDNLKHKAPSKVKKTPKMNANLYIYGSGDKGPKAQSFWQMI